MKGRLFPYLTMVSVIALSASAAHAQVAASAPAAQPAPAATAQPDTAQPDTSGITDIIVTANRREEKNQNVPISITAFSPQRLEQMNVTKAQDLASNIPSLVVGPNGQASRDVQSFTIRGQGATFQASPGVVVYLNEVPLPAALTLSQQGGPGNFVDLENLQVLAGPQGTLFGRNTTGGAVLLVPKKPTNDFEGFLDAKYGNYNDKELQGAINIPIVSDKLMVRVAGAYQDRNGYTRDLSYNRDVDNQHWYSGRIGIMWRPVAEFENYTMVYGAHSHNNGTGVVLEEFNIPLIAGYGVCNGPLTGPCSVYQQAQAQAQADGPRVTRPSTLESDRTDTWGIENTSKLTLTDNLALRNIISYQRYRSYYYYDADGTPIQQYDASYTSFPYPRDSYQDVTEELQLQGSGLAHRLTYTVGGFYYDQKPTGTQGVDAINFCPAAYTGFCAPQRTYEGVTNKSKALYAQFTLDLGAVTQGLDQFKLTGGYRYTWDQIDGFATTWTPQANGSNTCGNNNVNVAAGVDPYGPCYFDGHLRSHAPTWTIGLDRKIGTVLFYAKVSRGYKAGGFNSYSIRPSTLTFAPEYETSYEAGFKSDFHIAGLPARLNADYYFSNYTNIQKATGDFNTTTFASGAAVNAAKAHIQGVELEATLKPVRALELGGTFSYTHAVYTQYDIPADGAPDCTGASPAQGSGGIDHLACVPFQYVSPIIYAIHGDLALPLSPKIGNLDLYVNFAYSSHQYTDPDTLPQYQPGDKLAGYGLLNLTLNLRQVAGSNFDLGFFMTNATNATYRISNSNTYNNLATASTIYGEPRMYGVKLSYHFGR